MKRGAPAAWQIKDVPVGLPRFSDRDFFFFTEYFSQLLKKSRNVINMSSVYIVLCGRTEYYGNTIALNIWRQEQKITFRYYLIFYIRKYCLTDSILALM